MKASWVRIELSDAPETRNVYKTLKLSSNKIFNVNDIATFETKLILRISLEFTKPILSLSTKEAYNPIF